MKYLSILVIALLLAESLCVIVKTNQTNLLAIKAEKGQAQAQRIKNLNGISYKYNIFIGYPQMILRELNHFRRKNHYFPFIRWQNALAATAGSEAQHIKSKRSFGEHANFMNWKRKINSRFFTELSLLVDTQGMIPTKRIFAKTIIEALKQEQEWYLIHPYTQAGVAIIPDKRRNTYVVVIHLIRRPSRFRSCLEARRYGIRKSILTIYPRGKKYRVKCDQKTAGGGWTRIININHQQYGRVIRGLNDRQLHYRQVLFRARNNYYQDYARGGGGNRNNWDFNGYIFPLTYLRFGKYWYVCRQRPTHAGESNAIPHKFYNLNDKRVLQIRRGANRCFFGKTNRPQYCAKEFIFKRIPKGRLNAISDIESIRNKWTGDNQWVQSYEIFVR